MPFNASEEFVGNLCERSFLNLWSFANPIRQDNGRELCDVLIVNAPDVLIFQIKDVSELTKNKGAATEGRWKKKTESAVRQIYGAERMIDRGVKVCSVSGYTINIPASRRVHRIAVMIGRGDDLPLNFGDFGKGFVHVLDETSVWKCLGELDTITEFVDYLLCKQNLISSSKLLLQREEDLLGLYIHRGRNFPDTFNLLMIEPGIWEDLIDHPEYQARKLADQESKLWDGLILHFGKSALSGDLLGGDPAEQELSLRVLSRETRFNRRILSSALSELHSRINLKQEGARLVKSPSGVAYVFLVSNARNDEERKQRYESLHLRCYVSRLIHPDAITVIGIAIHPRGARIQCEDIVYLHLPEWDSEDAERARRIQNDLGYWKKPNRSPSRFDEFPSG